MSTRFSNSQNPTHDDQKTKFIQINQINQINFTQRERNYSQASNDSLNQQSEQKNQSSSNIKSYPFEIFIETQYFDQFQEGNFLKNLQSNYKIDIEDISNQKTQSLSKKQRKLKNKFLDGKIFKIDEKSMTKKSNCLEEILEKLSFLNKEQKYLDILSFVPECMVSLLIGAQGHQIKSIMDNSGSKIVVNQPIEQIVGRTVKISGKIKQIVKSFQIIYNFIEEKLPQVDQDSKGKESSQNIQKHHIQARFVFKEDVVGYIIGQKGAYVKELGTKYSVAIKFYNEKHIYCVKKRETICRISGKLDGVQQVILEILKKVSEVYKANENSKQDKEYPVKILMPSKFVTKLIGSGGSLIRDIAYKSGGAIIKIQSKKGDDRYDTDVIVKILGELALQQDASCLILEYLEIFASGIQNAAPDIISKQKKSRSRSSSSHRNKSRSYSSKKKKSKDSSISSSRGSLSKKFRYRKVSTSSSRLLVIKYIDIILRKKDSSSRSYDSKKYQKRKKSLSKDSRLLKFCHLFALEENPKKKEMLENIVIKANHIHNQEIVIPNKAKNNLIMMSLINIQNKKDQKNRNLLRNEEVNDKTKQKTQQPTASQPIITNQTLQYEISRDFAFKTYIEKNTDYIQLALLFPIEKYTILQTIIAQNAVNNKFGTKIALEPEKRFRFANNEQECFILKVLGLPIKTKETINYIINSLFEMMKNESQKQA